MEVQVLSRAHKVMEIKEVQEFNPNIIYPKTPFTQAPFYGDWQEALGRKVRRFVVSENGKDLAYFQLIKYPLVFGKSYLYSPYGPVVGECAEDLLKFIKKEIENISKEEGAVFTRLDFTPQINSEVFSEAPRYTYHSAHFQPRVEWVMDLNKTEEDLLMSFKKKTRYAVRLAQREGIEIEVITHDFNKYFDLFYELMSETANRDGFNLHPKEYYKAIFKSLEGTKSFLVIAKFKEKVLAVNLIIVFGKVANYVFGSSRDEERKKMPTYLAQWEGFLKAKELGCTEYSFGGISAGIDKYKGWDNLTLFKKKFPGSEAQHSKFVDVVSEPFWYYLYNFRKLLKGFLSW